MVNPAIYNDPALLQFYFANLLQGNQTCIPTVYPLNCGFNPYLGGVGLSAPGIQNCASVTEQTPAQLIPKDGPEIIVPSTILESNSNSTKVTKHVETSGQIIISTPERVKQEEDTSACLDKSDLDGGLETGHTEDPSLKKRRKECSIDSVNSVVETVATETNSNLDECSSGKKSRDETENRTFEIGQEDYAENEDASINVDLVNEGHQENILNSHYPPLKNEQTKWVSSDSRGQNRNSPPTVSGHEEDIFLSNDRKTSFDKILRIHSSLVGSLSWTAPVDKDGIVLKSTRESGSSKLDEPGKAIGQSCQDDYNPFIQREYNSSNVTCFSPRMLPDWQLNWLRDVTRSLSTVPKSPMTGIHFDRTKPAWAVSYYECETRKYYFFFIPDLSEYTVEITLAAAIGCRQNVVARGAHKRKKPGVLTFNLYSGQFEKSATETPVENEAGDNFGRCDQVFRKQVFMGGGGGNNSTGNKMKNANANCTNTSGNTNNGNLNFNSPHYSGFHLPFHLPFGNYGYNYSIPASNTPSSSSEKDLNKSSLENQQAQFPNFSHPFASIANQSHTHAQPAQMLYPQISLGQNSVQHAGVVPVVQGHTVLIDGFQQNALRNASLLYAATVSSGSPHFTLQNQIPLPVSGSTGGGGPAVGSGGYSSFIVSPASGSAPIVSTQAQPHSTIGIGNSIGNVSITPVSTAPSTPTSSTSENPVSKLACSIPGENAEKDSPQGGGGTHKETKEN
ncbi:AP2 domain transcription factor AP2IV-2 [Cryptosporidium felis]|nr:AP2 domain transcription factor AP2IV-2 [Cryptosporidium felis]